MSGLQSSWGLAVDLGENPTPEQLKAIYEHCWQQPEFKGPEFQMGELLGVPRAAEGKLLHKDQQLGCYTKFEKDDLGYPPGWEVPVLFSLSLFKLPQPLAELPEWQAFLQQQLQALLHICSARMAVIGDLSMYYLNAEMLLPEWIDLQQGSVLQLIVANSHPFSRQLSGQAFGETHQLFTQAPLQSLWTPDDNQTRFLRYKSAISEQLHSEKLTLEWEPPSQN